MINSYADLEFSLFVNKVDTEKDPERNFVHEKFPTKSGLFYIQCLLFLLKIVGYFTSISYKT